MDAALDTETRGLDWRNDRPFFVSIFYDADRAPFSVDLRETDDDRARGMIMDALRGVTRLFLHNTKFDLHALSKIGVDVDALWPLAQDTLVRETLIDEHLPSYKLDELAYRRLGRRKIDMLAEYGIAPDHWFAAPSRIVQTYCERDAELTLLVGLDQQDDIEAQDLYDVLDLEMMTLRAAFDMEAQGVRVDPDRAVASRRQIHRDMMELLSSIYSRFGRINPGSPVDLAQALGVTRGREGWITAGGAPIPSTPTGRPKMDVETLETIDHPLIEAVLRYRESDKLANTFLQGHIIDKALLRGGASWVHPNINTTRSLTGHGTGTGRLSYDTPALQQIPSRVPMSAQIVKSVFLPDPGQVWAYGDLDQNEFRVFAHFTGSEDLYGVYRDNPRVDFHQLVADITGLPRSKGPNGGPNAKQVNLGLLFSMGEGLLAQQMGLPHTVDKATGRLKGGPEVKEVLERYHAAIPGVREINATCTKLAESRGYIKTPIGRRIRISDPEYAYKAAGLMFQATAADINKRNIVTISNALRRSGLGRLLLNIHDEYSMSLDPGPESAELLEHLQGVLSDGGLRVPLSISFKTGDTWHDALS